MRATTSARCPGGLRLGCAILVLAAILVAASPGTLHAATSAITFTGTTDVFTTPNTPFTAVLAQMTDSDASAGIIPPTVTIAWGDGTHTDSVKATNTGQVIPPNLHVLTVSGSHTYALSGTYTISLNTVDSGGNPAQASLTAHVAAPALQVTLTPPGSFTEGVAWSGTIATVSDPGCSSGTVTYSFTIDWGDGSAHSTGTTSGLCGTTASIAASHTYARAGSAPLQVSASAAGAPDGSATQSVTIADAALGQAQAVAVSATEGAAFTAPLVTFQDSDPNATPSLYSVTIDWGDHTAMDTTSGAVTLAGNVFQVSGSHTYAEEGTYSAAVTVRDTGGSQTSATATATVADAALHATGATLTQGVGTQIVGIVATFSDSDTNGAVGDYSAAIDWGDGTGSDSSTTVQTATGGGFQVTGRHTYAHTGTYSTTVTIADAGASTQAHGTVNVGAGTIAVTVPAVSTVEGSSVSGTIATFTEPGCASGTTFSASVDWGDGGSTPSATVSGGCPSAGTVTAAHSYAAGTYTLKVHVASSDGSSGDGSAAVSISDAPVALQAVAINATAGSSFSGVVATFTDPVPTAPLSGYTATIAWGDGLSSPGSVTAVSGGFAISGSHTYSHRGTPALTVQLSDAGDARPASASATATVAPAPLVVAVAAVSATQGEAYSGPVATLTDPDPPAGPAPAYSATIDWGDHSTPTTATLTPASGGYTVTGLHTYAQTGSFAITVTASDGARRQSSAGGTATVTAGTLAGAALPFSAQAGTAYNGQLATFTDSGCAGGLAAYSATIDWGDGATSAGVLGGSCQHGFTVSATHLYSTPGAYAVVVTIDGGAGRALALHTTATVQAAPPSNTQPGGQPTGSSSAGNGFAPGVNSAFAGAPSVGINGGPLVLQSAPLLRSVTPLGGNQFRVEITSAAGTPVSAILALAHPPGGVLAAWRQGPDGWQACYFADPTAPLDAATTAGGIEVYVLTLAPGATIG